ncbi:DTW domain-containing protein 1 [Entomortierella beljakovae]|nr:DTW domain-containing protein 1 [Entomortierella beljakovae]
MTTTSKDAKRLSEIDPASFDKLVVIDGTWDQVKKMTTSDGPISKMRRVAIASHETLFWRHQRKADDHLATIEAIYYLLREYHEAYLSSISEDDKDITIKYESGSTSKETTTTTTKEATETVEGDSKEDSTKLILTAHNEWMESKKVGAYTNQYDDMLWFYKYFYELIQRNYRERTDGREFTLRHKKGYIQYSNSEQGLAKSESRE